MLGDGDRFKANFGMHESSAFFVHGKQILLTELTLNTT